MPRVLSLLLFAVLHFASAQLALLNDLPDSTGTVTENAVLRKVLFGNTPLVN